MGGYYSIAALPQWWSEGSRYYGKAGIEYAVKQNKRWESIAQLVANVKSKVSSEEHSEDKLTYLITGANSGIGYQCALQLSKSGANVHMLCRNMERGQTALEQIKSESANDKVYLHQVDMSSQTSIKHFADNFFKSDNNRGIDALINNAGVVMQERQVNEDGVEVCFATAMGGTFLLSSLCLNGLRKKHGRVVNISSGGMYLAKYHPKYIREGIYKEKYDGLLAYVQSKRAQVLLTKRWADMVEDGTVVFQSYQ